MSQTDRVLTGMNKEELKNLAVSLGEKPFRGEQIFQWIYQKMVSSIDEMSNISYEIREKLNGKFGLEILTTETQQVSSMDGTVKYLFRLLDGLKIESVLIPSSDNEDDPEEPRRLTLCLSTQVGCPAGCKFCATGMMGFSRNLSPGEIIGQVIEAQRTAPKRISNLVFMGMGEPMLNYENVMRAVDIIGDEKGIGISPRRITLSTVGYIDKIKRMADEKRRVKLAISLHTLDDNLRSEIIPLNTKYPVKELIGAARYYYLKTRQRVTFEYIHFKGLNDTERDIKELKKLSGMLACKLNVIPFHPVYLPENSGIKDLFIAPDKRSIGDFVQRLQEECDFPVMLRSSSGLDIAGACGQLIYKIKTPQSPE